MGRMKTPVLLLFVISLCGLIKPNVAQWGFTQDQVEVFDLVDETNLNFYEYLSLTQDATSAEIRRSYRKLSLTMHPDKNKTEGAEEGFRVLVAIYEVLKSKEKREIYDNVLVNGLPSAYLYVPRQIRKMSMLEVSIIISIIFTVGHFLFIWGSFLERKLTVEEMMPKLQKQQKRQKKKVGGKDVDNETIEELTQQFVQKPKLIDLLPILLVRKFYAFVVAVPDAIHQHKEQKKMIAEMEEEQKLEEELANKRIQEQLEKRTEAKRVKQERTKQKREEMLLAKKLAAESAPSKPSVFENTSSIEELEAMYDEMGNDFNQKKKKTKDKQWDDEDQAELIKLTTKYPRGTTERWQKIASEMGRTIQEVTAKASQAKESVGTKVKYSASTAPQVTPRNKPKVEIPDNIITTRSDDGQNENSEEIGADAGITTDESSVWDQSQQKLLEIALSQIPKSTPERWEKIAATVPNKTKEECMTRYKFLVDKIQQKRKQQS
uniref:DnaJ homolog subfamily C member 1 n=1 Tax=Phallusia mammillata TaxID=59560 RepID=A0A6F9DAK8_9ASCI|nr:dnaJ homolog subfamily C member 1 [Phallusia mammillata]